MSPEDIISMAIEYRCRYNTRDARIIASRKGMRVTEMDLNPKYVKAFIVQSDMHPTIISLNSHFTDQSKQVLCAHELGHALLHNNTFNEFLTRTDKLQQEYEANLFAVAFLSNESDFNCPLTSMSNYMLKTILDYNLHLKEE